MSETRLNQHSWFTNELFNSFKTPSFSADRTNGLNYVTVLRLSVCRLWRYVLWLNGAS